MTKKKTIPTKRADLIHDLKEFRERLGPIANNYTPSELRRLRDDMKVMAEVLIAFLLEERKNQSKDTIKY
jgi:hypothetical protein